MQSNAAFPNLTPANHSETSERSHEYNCIAWAADDNTRWWWPDVDSYWPVPVESSTPTLASFVKAFETLGYESCSDDRRETGYEKIAIFALQSIPTHAARQLLDGQWTSKLGRNIDISHSLDSISGPLYGVPAAFMRRPRK